MKHILLLLIICCCATFATAQTLTPQVISSAGTTFVNGSTTLDYTVGEPVTATLDNGSNQLSQGFHQNDLLITTITNSPSSSGIAVFPNPSVDVVNIQFAKPTDNNKFELYSADGKLLKTEACKAQTISQLDMNAFGCGTYFLKIFTDNKEQTSFKIIKSK